jgi:hypothetical protein
MTLDWADLAVIAAGLITFALLALFVIDMNRNIRERER